MNEREQAELRSATALQRTPPSQPVAVRIESDGIGLFPKDSPAGPIELYLEATNDDGELSAWLVDEWWTEVITHLPNPTISVHIENTPDALVHPVVLYQLAMLRRVCPRWRLVGHAYRDDLMTDQDVVALATSHYHEVRFIDAPRPGRAASDRGDSGITLGSVFSRIRRAQPEGAARYPTLICVPHRSTQPDVNPRHAATREQRPTGVARLEDEGILQPVQSATKK